MGLHSGLIGLCGGSLAFVWLVLFRESWPDDRFAPPLGAPLALAGHAVQGWIVLSWLWVALGTFRNHSTHDHQIFTRGPILKLSMPRGKRAMVGSLGSASDHDRAPSERSQDHQTASQRPEAWAKHESMALWKRTRGEGIPAEARGAGPRPARIKNGAFRPLFHEMHFFGNREKVL